MQLQTFRGSSKRPVANPDQAPSPSRSSDRHHFCEEKRWRCLADARNDGATDADILVSRWTDTPQFPPSRAGGAVSLSTCPRGCPQGDASYAHEGGNDGIRRADACGNAAHHRTGPAFDRRISRPLRLRTLSRLIRLPARMSGNRAIDVRPADTGFERSRGP